METSVEQMVALTCFGNAALRGISVDKSSLNHFSYQFSELVSELGPFLARGKSKDGASRPFHVADSPEQWFENLIKREIRGLRLRYDPYKNLPPPPYIPTAFVGGGIWEIEALRKDGDSEFWCRKRESGDRENADRRLRRAPYGLFEVAKTEAVPTDSLDALTQNLRKALNEIRDSSLLYANGAFVDLFDRGLNALDNPSADALRGNLFPSGVLPLQAEVLLKAAQHAWVFGGMGSWNDLGFPRGFEQEYRRVSTQLFDALNEAIAKAASSSGIIEMEMS